VVGSFSRDNNASAKKKQKKKKKHQKSSLNYLSSVHPTGGRDPSEGAARKSPGKKEKSPGCRVAERLQVKIEGGAPSRAAGTLNHRDTSVLGPGNASKHSETRHHLTLFRGNLGLGVQPPRAGLRPAPDNSKVVEAPCRGEGSPFLYRGGGGNNSNSSIDRGRVPSMCGGGKKGDPQPEYPRNRGEPMEPMLRRWGLLFC